MEPDTPYRNRRAPVAPTDLRQRHEKKVTTSMAQAYVGQKRIRRYYGKIREVLEMPNLIEVQKSSYDLFLRSGDGDKPLDDEGIQGTFQSVFPIKDFNETAVLEFVKYELEKPKYDVDECRQRGMTFKAGEGAGVLDTVLDTLAKGIYWWDGREFDRLVTDGETLPLGNLRIAAGLVAGFTGKGVVARETARGHAASRCTSGLPFGQVRLGAGAPGRIFPRQASGQREGGGIGQPAILVLLQPHALALGHFRQFVQREDEHFSVVTDHRHRIARDASAENGFHARTQGLNLLARFGLRHHLIRRQDEPIPGT